MAATFVSDFVQSLETKWEEIDTLLEHASDVQDTNEKLYNALCRSVTVLIVAHLEGFTKDLVKNLVKDLNNHNAFIDLPISFKRTYCKKYLGNNSEAKGDEVRLKRLIEKFEEIDCSISHEPFLFANNKNPNPHVVHTIFQNIGIKNIFYCLNESEPESIFSDSYPNLIETYNDIKNEVTTIVSDYPYNINEAILGLEKKKCATKTIWEAFLEEINNKRHAVAHGNNFNNSDSVSELQTRKVKVQILQQLLVIVVCQKV